MTRPRPAYPFVCALIADETRHRELRSFLLEESRLPGPRANLALAAAFADCFAVGRLEERQWELLLEWLGISADEAPTGDPREFLPFCATQALGAVFPTADGARRSEIATCRLRAAANDDRWRLREAVSMALQRIGERDFEAQIQMANCWLEQATLLEMRAIVTGLAHEPLFRSVDRARTALTLIDVVAGHAVALNNSSRRSESFRVLRKGLGFAPSVIVSVVPDEGFSLLERWAGTGDPDLRWIVRENLKKSRLSASFPKEVARILATMDT